MIENTTLKSVEEIILQNKKRNSRFISIMNSLFENIYKNFILCYCYGNEDEFKECVKDIIETYSFPDSDFEKENLFIIKQLVILALKQNTSEDVFVNQKLVLSNFVNVNIKYNEWDNLERWPYLSYTLNKQYFANTYNEFHEYLSFKTTFSIVSSSYKTFPSTSTCFTVKSFNAIRKRSAKTIIIIDKIFRKCRNLFFFFRFSLIILSPTKFVSSQNYIFSSFMPFDTDNTSPISAIRKITDVPP